MNQDWQEKRIKRLFDEMRREDERLAPSFARVINRPETLKRRARLLPRLAFAAAILIMLGGSAWFAVSILKQPSPPGDVETMNRPVAHNDKILNPIIVDPVRNDEPKRMARAVRRPRIKPKGDGGLISRWQAPTDFLLATQGEELLRTVPRIGEPSGFITILKDSNK